MRDIGGRELTSILSLFSRLVHHLFISRISPNLIIILHTPRLIRFRLLDGTHMYINIFNVTNKKTNSPSSEVL